MTILAGIESWRFRWGLGIYLNGELTPDGVIGYGASITYCRSPGPTEIVLGAVDTSGNVSAPSNPLLFPADRLPAASRLHYVGAGMPCRIDGEDQVDPEAAPVHSAWP